MTVDLTPEQEALIASKIATGNYHSASEVLDEALRLLKEWDSLNHLRAEQLRKDIAVGIEQAERGQMIDGEEVFRRLHAKLDQPASQAS